MDAVTHNLKDTTKINVLNPFTPRRDGQVDSPHNGNTLSRRWVVRVKTFINLEMLLESPVNFHN